MVKLETALSVEMPEGGSTFNLLFAFFWSNCLEPLVPYFCLGAATATPLLTSTSLDVVGFFSADGV